MSSKTMSLKAKIRNYARNKELGDVAKWWYRYP